MSQDELKLSVARAALDYVPDGKIIGVGTGSTANFFIARDMASFVFCVGLSVAIRMSIRWREFPA